MIAPTSREHRSPLHEWAPRVLLATVGLLAVGVLVLVVAVPRLTGGAARLVRSGSMAPAIPQGALVLDRPVPVAELHAGDVATYGMVGDDGRRRLVTHRVVAVDRSVNPVLVTFRGDANRSDDAVRIPIGDVQGRVWLVIPGVGSAWAVCEAVRWPLLALAAAAAAGFAFAARRRSP